MTVHSVIRGPVQRWRPWAVQFRTAVPIERSCLPCSRCQWQPRHRAITV